MFNGSLIALKRSNFNGVLLSAQSQRKIEPPAFGLFSFLFNKPLMSEFTQILLQSQHGSKLGHLFQCRIRGMLFLHSLEQSPLKLQKIIGLLKTLNRSDLWEEE